MIKKIELTTLVLINCPKIQINLDTYLQQDIEKIRAILG
jgi:hypothetical protein